MKKVFALVVLLPCSTGCLSAELGDITRSSAYQLAEVVR